jgi:restriction system protein
MGRRRYGKSSSSSDIGALVLIVGFSIWSNIGTPMLIVSIAIIVALLLLYYRWRSKRILDSGIDLIDKMDGIPFEKLLDVYFAKCGYKVSLTPASNDYGADLIIQKDGVKTVVQAKRYKGVVGIGAVQEIIGSIAHYGADRGMVITNSRYTQQAKNLAQTNRIELWDRFKLMKVLREVNGRHIAESISAGLTTKEEPTVVERSDALCLKCNGVLIKRKGKNGEFWGCSNFPKCHFTKDI